MGHSDKPDVSGAGQRLEPVGLSFGLRPWRWIAAVLLGGIAMFIWMVAGPLGVRYGEHMLPSNATWEDTLVLDARFWFTTGIVEYVQGLVVQRPTWRVVGLWALHAALVPAARRLGVRHWLAGFVVTPMLLGQLTIVFLYCSGAS